MKNLLKGLLLSSLVVTFSYANNSNCYQISNSSDREACLGHAYSTDNKDARNIILKNCYLLSNRANESGLRQVCLYKKQGCYSLKSSKAVNSCVSCSGSNKWARMYAVGYLMQCYR